MQAVLRAPVAGGKPESASVAGVREGEEADRYRIPGAQA